MIKMSIDTITFKLLTERKGYCIYYAIPTNHIKTGNEKTLMIVTRYNEIVYVADSNLCQFKMKLQCDKFIEERIENE